MAAWESNFRRPLSKRFALSESSMYFITWVDNKNFPIPLVLFSQRSLNARRSLMQANGGVATRMEIWVPSSQFGGDGAKAFQRALEIASTLKASNGLATTFYQGNNFLANPLPSAFPSLALSAASMTIVVDDVIPPGGTPTDSITPAKDEGEDKISGGAIAGAVIGSLVGAALLGVGGWFIYKRFFAAKKQQPQDLYTIDGSPAPPPKPASVGDKVAEVCEKMFPFAFRGQRKQSMHAQGRQDDFYALDGAFHIEHEEKLLIGNPMFIEEGGEEASGERRSRQNSRRMRGSRSRPASRASSPPPQDTNVTFDLTTPRPLEKHDDPYKNPLYIPPVAPAPEPVNNPYGLPLGPTDHPAERIGRKRSYKSNVDMEIVVDYPPPLPPPAEAGPRVGRTRSRSRSRRDVANDEPLLVGDMGERRIGRTRSGSRRNADLNLPVL